MGGTHPRWLPLTLNRKLPFPTSGKPKLYDYGYLLTTTKLVVFIKIKKKHHHAKYIQNNIFMNEIY